VLVVAGMLALACAAIVAIGRLQVEVPFKLTTGALWEILRLVSKDRSDQANEASDLAARQAAKADLALRRYNDTFGHPAGDAVLELLGGRLADAVTSCGSAYRMGGDEFCVVVSVQEDAAEDVAILGASALTENGVGFSIVSSYGTALMPAEAGTASDALRLADQRMYEHKHAARALAGRGSSAA
jgi:GGDEF domain-containing protein